MRRPRTPGQRAGLTREAVLTQARELLAERGLEGLTLRALADRLGVAPNTLYSHVADKTALVDDLLDAVLGEVEAPAPDRGDPRRGLQRLLASTYRVLLAHPTLVPLYLARQGARGPNARHLGDVMVAMLARMGVTGRRAQEALRVLVVYTIGFAALTTGSTVGPAAEDAPPLSPEEIRRNFLTGLRWLLTGIVGRSTR